MKQFIWECCIVFFVCNLIIVLETKPLNVDHQLTNSIENENVLAVWKPPNMMITHLMDRKKRSSAFEDGYKDPTLEKQYLASPMDDASWTVNNFKGGKRRTIKFIPRLGRQSAEESKTETWLRLMNQQFPFFIPSIERRNITYHNDEV